MTEPTTALAASAVGVAKSAAGQAAISKLLILFATGALGAAVMAALRPQTGRQLFIQALVAGVISTYFTESVMDVLSIPEKHKLPIGFLLGAMSWGLVGAAVRLRDIVSQRGGDAIAHRVGLDEHSEAPNG
jgi:hypothetical protein